MKKVFEPVTKSIKDISEEVTKTIRETNNNNKTLEIFNSKLLEIMNDRGILATTLMSLLSKITNPKNTRQFQLVNFSSSNRVNDLLIHNTIPLFLNNTLLTFRDTGKDFELKGDFLKMTTNKNYNVDLARLQYTKLMYEFAKEMNFDTKVQGKKSARDRTLIKLNKPPSLMVSASGVSKTKILSSDPNVLCDRLKLLLQEKHGGNNSDIINEEIVAIVDNL